VLGPEDTDTLEMMLNYSIILDELKKYKEAEQQCRQGLKVVEKLADNGPNRFLTRGFASILAGVLVKQDRVKEAEAISDKYGL